MFGNEIVGLRTSDLYKFVEVFDVYLILGSWSRDTNRHTDLRPVPELMSSVFFTYNLFTYLLQQ